jgi:uncharacterized RDD family membrane protein YckC
MYCGTCGNSIAGQFCPNCGSRAGMDGGAVGALAAPATDVGMRVAAYLIDVIPMVIVSFVLGWIPIVGAVMLGFVLVAYWLLRDITGNSLGKILLGLKVTTRDGQESGTRERLLRNLPLIAGPALLIIPVAGMVIAPVVAGLVLTVEGVLLLAKKERLGDMLAGTTVLKKDRLAQAASA